MWHAVATLCSLQLWLLLGLLPASAGGLLAWIWTGVAALVLAAGIVALRRHPDAGALLLGVVLPITVIPTFVLARRDVALLHEPFVHALAGATLAVGLVAVALARRAALVPGSVPEPAMPARDGAAARRAPGATGTAVLLLAALWLALPLRALLDPTLLDGALAGDDPVRAKEILLVVSWAAATVLALGAVVPALGRGVATSRRRGSPATLAGAGLVLLAAWGGLVFLGA